MNPFAIDYTLFTVWGYPLCLLELLGVITGVVAVFLASRGKVVNFYIGLVNNVLYFMLFYQYQLYSMMLLQAVYFMISSYGIYSWTHGKGADQTLSITKLKPNQLMLIVLIIVVVGAIWGNLVVRFSGLYPEYIEKPNYPYIDATLTIASVIGQLLLTRKKLDNWSIWMVVNTCSIMLYVVMGMYFTVLLYVIYLVIAVQAYKTWSREMESETKNKNINREQEIS